MDSLQTAMNIRQMSSFKEFYNYDGWKFVVLATDKELEECHNYIQLTFPNREPSQFNLKAHLLTDEDVAFAQSEEMQAKIRAVYSRMLLFYFPGATNRFWWVKRNDHNHLRMTRIIHFLKECSPDLAEDFFYRLNDIVLLDSSFKRALENSYQYWADAFAGKQADTLVDNIKPAEEQ